MREVLQKKAVETRQKNPNVRHRSSAPCPDTVTVLQHTIGNRAVEGLFRSGVLQTKLKIGQPNDIHEREADRAADEVMRMPDTTFSVEPSAISRGSNSIQMKPG